ncbi:hypothetical protein D3C76_35280 [compost metagenome]
MLHFAPVTLTRQKVKLRLRISVTLSRQRIYFLIILKIATFADKVGIYLHAVLR